MQFLNPRTDFAFKKIFGSAESKDILLSFLNAILNQQRWRLPPAQRCYRHYCHQLRDVSTKEIGYQQI